MIAIGDIHGCYRTLEGLLDKLSGYPNDTLIFIGDYIDRGSSSKEVIERLIALGTERECVFLRGNHEQMLLDVVERDDQRQLRMWLMNGGESTLKSYSTSPDQLDIPESHMEFFRKTLFYHVTNKYFFVHAGAPANQSLEDSLLDSRYKYDFLWSRDHLNVFDPPWEKKVIFGHTPRPEPIRSPKRLGIDTGCVLDGPGYGKLTAVKLPEELIIQQESLEMQ